MTSIPDWKDLPAIELYLDQVLLYVNQVTAPLLPATEKALTPSMINNYVKNGYLPKPVKKKYGRSHLARLIALSLLKPVFAIQDIASSIDKLLEESKGHQLYDTFVQGLAGETVDQALIQSACQTISLYQQTLALVQTLGDNHEPDA